MSSEPTHTPGQGDVLDMEIIDSLREIDGDDGPDLLAELVEMYRADAPDLIATMRDAGGAGDAQALRHAAHTLKGSSANLGAARLADLASQIELIGRDGTTEGTEELLRHLQAEYERVDVAFNTLLAT